MDVVRQHAILKIGLFDARADDIPDRDDADQLTVIEDGQVPDLVLRHDTHDVANLIVRDADDEVGCHDVPDERGTIIVGLGSTLQEDTSLPAFPQDVAFREDSLDVPVLVRDDDRADVMLVQDSDGVVDGLVRLDRHDTTPLVPQDVSDAHVAAPFHGWCLEWYERDGPGSGIRPHASFLIVALGTL